MAELEHKLHMTVYKITLWEPLGWDTRNTSPFLKLGLGIRNILSPYLLSLQSNSSWWWLLWSGQVAQQSKNQIGKNLRQMKSLEWEYGFRMKGAISVGSLVYVWDLHPTSALFILALETPLPACFPSVDTYALRQGRFPDFWNWTSLSFTPVLTLYNSLTPEVMGEIKIKAF